MVRDGTKEYINNETYHWEIGYDNPMGKYITKKEGKFINLFLKKNNYKVLDIGGGSGRFAIPISNQGIDITVLDPSLVALKLLTKKKCSINKVVGVGDQIPFKQNTFDLILVIEVIHYIENLEQFLSDCKNLLKDNGLLVFTIFNRANYKRFHPDPKKRKLLFNYTRSYKEYEKIIIFNGFSVEKASGFYWLPVGRGSVNPLIPLFAFIEDVLELHCIPHYSPWVLIASRKRTED